MADTETIAQYRIGSNVEVPAPRPAITRLKRWLFANRTVYDAFGKPVGSGGGRETEPAQNRRDERIF